MEKYDDKWFIDNGFWVLQDNDKSNRYPPTLMTTPKWRTLVQVLFKKTTKISDDGKTVTHSCITQEMIDEYLNATSA